MHTTCDKTSSVSDTAAKSATFSIDAPTKTARTTAISVEDIFPAAHDHRIGPSLPFYSLHRLVISLPITFSFNFRQPLFHPANSAASFLRRKRKITRLKIASEEDCGVIFVVVAKILLGVTLRKVTDDVSAINRR